MLTTARSFLASHRDASKLVERAEKFSVRLPVVGRVAVPPPDQLAFYGVVGGLAALGLIDWPVALAIGVGQVVVARHFNDERPAAAEAESPAAAEVKAAPAASAPKARKTTSQKATPRKATPRKTTSQKATPRKAAPRKAAAGKASGNTAKSPKS
ncbi:MAG: hypothetical protein U1C73_17425 [Dietzia sp.]|nr:hypothetical protein [Dietzia sp.]